MLLAVDGPLVRQARENLGLTRKELCKDAGIALSTLKKVERGCCARPGTVKAIAGVLGVDARLLAVPKGYEAHLVSLSA